MTADKCRVWFPWYDTTVPCWSAVPDVLWRLPPTRADGDPSVPRPGAGVPRPDIDARLLEERFGVHVDMFCGEHGPLKSAAHGWWFLSNSPCPRCGNVHTSKRYHVSTFAESGDRYVFTPCYLKQVPGRETPGDIKALFLLSGESRAKRQKRDDDRFDAVWVLDTDKKALSDIKNAPNLRTAVELCVCADPKLAHWLGPADDGVVSTNAKGNKSNELHDLHPTTVEPLFLDEFRTRLVPYLTLEEPRCARLLTAWRCLEHSGMLQKLHVEHARERHEREAKLLADAQAAKDKGVPLRTCALPSCGAREAHVAHFKKCSGCRGAFYCSKQHQEEHWPAHKAACKAARKAASQAAADGAPQKPQ